MRHPRTPRKSLLLPKRGPLALVLAWLLVTALAGPSQAEDWVLPDDRLGVATAPLLLLSRPDVQADLKLDPNQVGDARRKIVELYRAAAALRDKAGEELIAGRRAIDGEQKRWLNGHLTREQLGRLAQIELQWEGPSTVIRRSILAESLRLKPEQRASLEKAVADREARVQGGALPRDADQELAGVVMATLEEPQKAIWKSTLGEPFQIKPSVAAKDEPTTTRR